MSTKIKCPHCEGIYNNWEDYAKHILDAHIEDEERCIWARDALATLKRISTEEEPTYRGKSTDHIPPGREVKLPEYIRKQL